MAKDSGKMSYAVSTAVLVGGLLGAEAQASPPLEKGLLDPSIQSLEIVLQWGDRHYQHIERTGCPSYPSMFPIESKSGPDKSILFSLVQQGMKYIVVPGEVNDCATRDGIDYALMSNPGGRFAVVNLSNGHVYSFTSSSPPRFVSQDGKEGNAPLYIDQGSHRLGSETVKITSLDGQVESIVPSDFHFDGPNSVSATDAVRSGILLKVNLLTGKVEKEFEA